MTLHLFLITVGFLFFGMVWMMVSLKWSRYRERPSSCCGGIRCATHDHGDCGQGKDQRKSG